MHSRSSLAALFLAACLVVGFLAGFNRHAEAQSVGRQSLRTYTGSISVSNAAVTSDIAAGDMLVVRSMQVASSQAGTLTFTDGASGNAVLHVYCAANTPRVLDTALFGPTGIKLTRGAELYVNALSSATISVSMATALE